MSATFAADHTLPPKLDRNVGTRSLFFQPPTTPSASSSLDLSTASLGPNESNSTSRKRSRHDSLRSHQSAPYSATPSTGWSDSTLDPPSALLASGTMSPAPLVSSQYRLAGGLDTPTAAVASALERDDYGYGRYTPDASYRRGRSWSNNATRSAGHTPFDGYFPPVSSTTSRVSGARIGAITAQPANDGWRKAVFGVVGGAAFRVLNFCKSGAFRGFFAGGGQGYQMGSSLSSSQVGAHSVWQDMEEKCESHRLRQRATTRIPGQFPEEDFISEYMSQDHVSPSRPSKKVQRQKGEGDIRSNWIMVASTPTSRESSPSRVSVRKVPSASSPGRRGLASNGRPALGTGGRRPILPASRPSLTSYAGSPALRSNRPASYASSRSSPTTTPKHESPVAVEARRFAAKARKRELEEEANLRRFNQQLKAMIREGKQALGTRVEIEDDVDELTDEGYAEGDLFDERAKG